MCHSSDPTSRKLFSFRSQEPQPPPPISGEGENEYEVEILDSRRGGRSRKLKYLVDRKAYGKEARGWVEASDFDFDDGLAVAFHRAYPFKLDTIGLRQRYPLPSKGIARLMRVTFLNANEKRYGEQAILKGLQSQARERILKGG